ncbi:unnamed protein product [Diplocarpon coronariae]
MQSTAYPMIPDGFSPSVDEGPASGFTASLVEVHGHEATPLAGRREPYAQDGDEALGFRVSEIAWMSTPRNY